MKRSDRHANNRFVLHRREMVLATAATFFPLHGASGETGSRNTQSDVGINADPAVPIPAPPSLGTGKDRALVLGGGGEYFIAWLLGFAHGLAVRAYPTTWPILLSAPRPERSSGLQPRAIVSGCCATISIFLDSFQNSGGFDTDERVQPQSGARA